MTYESSKHFVHKFSASGEDTKVHQGLDNLLDVMYLEIEGSGT